jgi:hypothetical protein
MPSISIKPTLRAGVAIALLAMTAACAGSHPQTNTVFGYQMNQNAPASATPQTANVLGYQMDVGSSDSARIPQSAAVPGSKP